jgi:hypothetical protein
MKKEIINSHFSNDYYEGYRSKYSIRENSMIDDPPYYSDFIIKSLLKQDLSRIKNIVIIKENENNDEPHDVSLLVSVDQNLGLDNNCFQKFYDR